MAVERSQFTYYYFFSSLAPVISEMLHKDHCLNDDEKKERQWINKYYTSCITQCWKILHCIFLYVYSQASSQAMRIKSGSNIYHIILFILFHIYSFYLIHPFSFVFYYVWRTAADSLSTPRFTKHSWIAFSALRGAYKHIQVSQEYIFLFRYNK